MINVRDDRKVAYVLGIHEGLSILQARTIALLGQEISSETLCSEVAMHSITMSHREITPDELVLIRQDFKAVRLSAGVPPVVQQRHTVVAELDERLVGCATGLQTENSWFYLTDLWVAPGHRCRGLGSNLLGRLEHRIVHAGVTDIYAETAAFEAPLFYEHRGYTRFFELRNFYLGGHSRFGYQKHLPSSAL